MGKEREDGLIRFFRPEGEVEDVIMRVAITADGVPMCHYGKDTKSVEVISMTIRSVNGVKQASRAFTQYLGLCTSRDSNQEGSHFQTFFWEVVRSTAVMGRIGWYVKKNGKWRHIRMVVEEILADYKCLCSIMGHGQPSADYMCLKCPAKRGYFCMLNNAIVDKRWESVLFSKQVITAPSSFIFLHPQSLFRAVSAVWRAKQGKMSITKVMELNSEERKLSEKEEQQILEDFEYLDLKYLFQWTPVVLSPETTDRYLFDEISECTSLSVEEIKEICKGVSKLSLPPEGKEEKYSLVLLLPKKGIVGLDGMHSVSAEVEKCSEAISSCYNNAKSEEKKNIADGMNMYITTEKCLEKIPGEVPKLVLILAFQRIEELQTKGFSWLTPSLVFSEHVNRLTCEQRIVLYFNLFPYIFQDSLHIPMIHYMKKVFCIIARLYTLKRGRKKAYILQQRLSYYLGQLQSNTLPSFMTTLLHVANHLYLEIRFHGSIQSRTCFIHERNYKTTKGDVKAMRYVIEFLSKNEFVRNIIAMVGYNDNETTISTASLKKSKLSLYNSRDVLPILKRIVVDDFVQSLNTSKLRKTYPECLNQSEDACDMWDMENERWMKYMDGLTWDGIFYSSLTWDKKKYFSTIPPKPESDHNQWILENQKKLGWVYNSDETITYYIIRQYVVGRYGESHHVVALCNPIKTYSCDTDTDTPHSLIVDENWMEEINNIHFVSLYRLHVGCLAYWYGEKTLVGLSMMGINLYQFSERPGDTLFKSIKEKVKQGNK